MKKILIALAIILCLTAPLTMFAGCNNVDKIDDNYRVFYQIFVGSFSDSDGDGIGDLRGVINRMDYLNDGNTKSGKSLGVQGIWLSPIFHSPTYHKYDAADYYKVDSSFGTEDDLKELINLCHERNVKLILDLAINHTSTMHPWFTNFTAARRQNKTDDPYYDYYTCVTIDEKVSGRKYYGVPGCNGLVYEANFDSGMPELNYDNADVRQAVLDVAKYYLDMGIDGFRFDAIKYIYYGDTEKTVEFWNWYMDELRKINPDIYTVGECWSADSEVQKYYPALDCFSFTSAQGEGTIAQAARNENVNTFANYVANWQKTIKQQRADAMYMPFISNHDLDRAAGYLQVSSLAFGDNDEIVESKQAYMAANIYLLCTGSPFIYYGEEIGMKGTRGSANTDANRRLAMLWGDDDTVKDPVGTTFKSTSQINGTVASQLDDANSLLNYYAKVIAMRNKYPQIARGDYTAILSQDKYFAGFAIEYNGATTYLLHNVSATKTVTVDLSTLDVDATKVLDYIGQGTATLKGSTLTLAPQTSVILK